MLRRNKADSALLPCRGLGKSDADLGDQREVAEQGCQAWWSARQRPGEWWAGIHTSMVIHQRDRLQAWESEEVCTPY